MMIAKNSVGTASAYARENKTFFIRKKIITYPYFDFKPQNKKESLIRQKHFSPFSPSDDRRKNGTILAVFTRRFSHKTECERLINNF